MKEKYYRKKPVVIKAKQWFKHGDHYAVTSAKLFMWFFCERCKTNSGAHGYIHTLEGGHTVCPGDWIITGVKGEHYPCKPDVFKESYERVDIDDQGGAN